MSNIENLVVRKKAVELAKTVYILCSSNEQLKKYFWLRDQIQRSAVSIASNISEWADRGSKKDFARFLYIARWSCSELKTQLIIIKDLYDLDSKDYTTIEEILIEVHKMLNAFIKKLQ